ncbi:MAG: tetratricopeptide repeat protein, partial [Phycisphaerae bacterium]
MRRIAAPLFLFAAVLVCQVQSAPEKPAGPAAATLVSKRSGERPGEKPGKPDTPATRPARDPRDDEDKQLRQRLEKARRIAGINRRLVRLFEAGKYTECRPLLQQILEIDPNNSIAWYNLACVYSRVGRKDKAVESLNTAVEHGYSGFRHLERDPDLEAIRKTPGYKRLIDRKDEIQRQRAARIRDHLREQFGEGYIYEIDHDRKLVFATNVDRRTLVEMKQRLTAYAAAQWKGLFTHPFERYLTIVIPRSSDWRWPGRGGFYSRGPHMLYARTVGLTLVHEFTHALHAADQDGFGQDHPIWITEGLATLFESSRIVAGRAVPQPNRRLNMLQGILRRKRTIPFGQFVRYSHPKFMSDPMTAYAQCRYMLMYLHSKGLLKRWYDAYTAGYDGDRSGATALTEVCGKELAEIEADWKKWVMELDAPVLRLPPEHAYLGIQLQAGVDGVRIARVVPDSGADEAGL